MDFYTKEIHAVGSQMVHLICDRVHDSQEFRALIEGGGMFFAKAFPTAFEADVWLHELFHRMFRGTAVTWAVSACPTPSFSPTRRDWNTWPGCRTGI